MLWTLLNQVFFSIQNKSWLTFGVYTKMDIQYISGKSILFIWYNIGFIGVMKCISYYKVVGQLIIFFKISYDDQMYVVKHEITILDYS